MLKRKITVTTGSRAEYGILRPVLREINRSKKLELCLLVTGTHLSKIHGMTINEIKKDGFKIFSVLKLLPQDDSTFFMAKTVGEGVIKFAKIFKKIKPDINLILGDRDEMLASTIAAYHMNIPNAHIHGGDVSGGMDEYNRHSITKMSNIHFAATKVSKQRIIKMGENPKFVFMTGSPSIDEITKNMITSRKELERKYQMQAGNQTIVLVQHPVTTQVELTKKQIQNTIKAIVQIGKPTIAISPNSDSGSKIIFSHLKHASRKYEFLKLYNSIPRGDYLGLIKNCGVLVGNSSSGIIEASYFGTPIVNIGIRQKKRQQSKNVINVEDVKTSSIQSAIKKALKKRKKTLKNINKYMYGDGNASQKIIKHIEKISLSKELIEKQISF